MATKTLYLNSTGVTPTNIHASTDPYTTPAIAKDGGTYRIAIGIDLSKALGVTRSIVNSIKLHYTVYGTRTSFLGSKGTVDTGYSSYGDIYQTYHEKAIGRGSGNATPFSDDINLPYAIAILDETTIIMRFTNPIAAQTNSFVISNLSIVIDYTPSYGVTVEASPSEYGEVAFENKGGGTPLHPSHGSQVTFTATPYSGYRFVKWQDGNTDNPRTITITSDVHFIGYFEEKSYTITFENYDGTVLQTIEVKHGEIPEYTGVTPKKPSDAQYDYVFSTWSPSIVAVTGTATYKAVFNSILRYYTVSVTDGVINLVSGNLKDGKYSYGSALKIIANEKVGYKFVNWSGNSTSTEKEIPYTVTGNVSFIANYRLLQMKFKSIKILHHSNNEVASPTNPLIGGEDQAIIKVEIALE